MLIFKELLKVLSKMISGRIYFRKDRVAVINLSGDDVEKLKTKMESGDQLIVRIEEDGTKLVMKQEKSIKI